MSPFVRKVKTASGATAVQIVEKKAGQRRILEHLGSAHTQAELAALLAVADRKLHEGQDQLFDADKPPTGAPRPARGGPVVTANRSELLWSVLADAYARLGFDVVDDEAFRALVLARIIEPVSKLDTIRVLDELGIAGPHLSTIKRSL